MKKIFLSLLLGFVGLISFSNAGSFTYNGHFEGTRSNAGRVVFSIPAPFSDMTIPSVRDFTLVCTFSNYTGVSSMDLKLHEFFYSEYNFSFQDNVIKQQDIVQNNVFSIGKAETQQYAIGFAFYNNNAFSNKTSFDYSCVYSGTYVIGGGCPACPECETCPEVNTGDILSGSCDTNYCVENGLCPTASGSWSELKINDVVHEGRPFINLLIPDYIHWDYSVDENQYDIYVGSGYDQDYIDSVLKINSYRPDSADFTDTFVSGLTLIFPYIFVALLIVFIWKLLKRIFK